jgi:hydrogenase expression/formation protein HypD
MTFIDKFRDKEVAKILVQKIRDEALKPVRLMEVCGGHTMAIRKFGINSLLPATIELLSGPGCPVCVTDQKYIDTIIVYARQPDIIVVTYGDLIRVPGSSSSLDKEKAAGADVRIIYSTSEALDIAYRNPEKKIIFAAIGFETTTPATAIAVLQAKSKKFQNFYILCAHKVMPPVMSALIVEGIPIDGYIGPGHVCTIAGSKIFTQVAEKYKIPIVISGFEPIDLLESILLLIHMNNKNNHGVEIQYRRLVSTEGNSKAQKIVDEVFEPASQNWRGIGNIPHSGLQLKKEFHEFDAQKRFPIKVIDSLEPKGCLCGFILKGLKKPVDCSLFGKSCTPEAPVGACMVSSEGACNSYYNYQSFYTQSL